MASTQPARFHDGSFECPTAPAGFFTPYFPGRLIGPWQVTDGAVGLIGAGTRQAAEGDQSVDLNGIGAVSQTFTTTPGATCTITYNPLDAPALKTGKVLVDGQNFQDFSVGVTGKTCAAMGYVRRQPTFVATNPTTTLAFASTTGATAPNGAVIDGVRVEGGTPCSSCATP
ncbi:DUF642 domain-containing protein [Streptomyces sp. NPDC006798]|uniref:DUF642 domain-containing protein n=1 Tax=Streptomyces sp. NPDC006798 TaxID=3155462 RepID=UPI0033C6AC78